MSAAPKRHVTRRVVVRIAAAVTCLILVLSYPRGFVWTERDLTNHEWVVFVLAKDLGEPALCREISWHTLQHHYDYFANKGSSFYRSDCYEAVAEIRGDPDVCWAVRPLVDFDPRSDGHSALSCRRNTRARVYPNASLSDDTLVHTFEELGYDVDELDREGLSGPPAISLEDIYRGAAYSRIAIPQAQALLRRPDTVTAEDAAYLADLLAISSRQAEWCERIPAGMTLREQQAPFREWCLLSVASNTGNPRICDRMRVDSEPQRALQSTCRNDAVRGLRFGPEVPPDQLQTRRLISALGLAVPSPHSLPVSVRADIFRRFLGRLAPSNKDPAAQAARNELVRRLLHDHHH